MDKYDVRTYTGRNRDFYNRCILPLYDDVHRNIVGVTGRVIKDGTFPKWRLSDGFPAASSLFNYCFARHFVTVSRTVILVESPLNVLRLEEAGIHNSMAFYGGSGLTPAKMFLLDKLGTMKVILITDNDEAGEGYAISVPKAIARQFNYQRILVPEGYNDVADMSVEQVKTVLAEKLHV